MVCQMMAAPTRLPELRVGDTVYSNVTVLLVTSTDLYFRHQSGLCNVKLKFLEPALQAKFGYNPAVAAAVERRLIEADRSFNEAVAQQIAVALMQRQRGPATLGERALTDPLTSNSHVNKPLPPIQVEKWLTDAPSISNRMVILFFWTTESLPCRTYIELYNEWQKKLSDELIIIGICNEKPETVIGFTELPVQFALAADSNKKLAETLGIAEVPQIVLVDPKGIVRYKGHPAAISEKTVRSLIEFFSTLNAEQQTGTAPPAITP